MAGEKKIYRYTAGHSGSSTQVDTVKVVREKEGVFLRGSNYLLGKLPFTKNEFEHWSTAKKVVIGYLLWLVVLPIWPLVVLSVVWINGKVVSKLRTYTMLILAAVLWFWLIFSLIGIL